MTRTLSTKTFLHWIINPALPFGVSVLLFSLWGLAGCAWHTVDPKPSISHLATAYVTGAEDGYVYISEGNDNSTLNSTNTSVITLTADEGDSNSYTLSALSTGTSQIQLIVDGKVKETKNVLVEPATTAVLTPTLPFLVYESTYPQAWIGIDRVLPAISVYARVELMSANNQVLSLGHTDDDLVVDFSDAFARCLDVPIPSQAATLDQQIQGEGCFLIATQGATTIQVTYKGSALPTIDVTAVDPSTVQTIELWVESEVGKIDGAAMIAAVFGKDGDQNRVFGVRGDWSVDGDETSDHESAYGFEFTSDETHELRVDSGVLNAQTNVHGDESSLASASADDCSASPGLSSGRGLGAGLGLLLSLLAFFIAWRIHASLTRHLE